MKKIISVILIVILVFGIAESAFAAENIKNSNYESLAVKYKNDIKEARLVFEEERKERKILFLSVQKRK
ncbi:MAG: hypothetical protein U9Q80_08140 [Bacillota bacterium]|nr:hypothetical protein [Bacillota bacterium]